MSSHLVGALVAGALLLGAPLVPAQEEQQAQKVLKATLAQAVKGHAQDVKALVAPGTSALQQTKAGVSSGASAPGDGIESLASLMTLLDVALSEETSSTVLVDVSIAVDTALAAAGLPLPKGALVGTGGLLDKRLAKIGKRHRAALAVSRKAARAVLPALAKLGLPAALRTPDTLLPAYAPGFFGGGPVAGGSPEAFAPPPLQLTALVGSSDGDVPGDGALQVTGFTLIADDVKLSGRGPQDDSFGPLVVTPLADGTFEATFTGLTEGNWRIQAIQAVALATDYVGIPGAPDPGTDAASAAQVAKQAKAAWKQLVKQHGVALSQQLKAFKVALKDARKAVKSGADPEPVIEGVHAALEAFHVAVEQATNGASGAGGVATTDFGAGLDGLDQLVAEQLVGHGLANDKASTRIERRLRARAAMATRAARAFARFLAKKTDWRLAAGLEPVLFRRAAPVKGPELPDLNVPLRIELLTGCSRVGVDGDGLLRLRVNGDEAQGPRIDLALFGPDGYVLVDTLSAPDIVGGLSLRYPESGPGDLPEGNYVVVLRQGSVVASAALAVPGAD